MFNTVPDQASIPYCIVGRDDANTSATITLTALSGEAIWGTVRSWFEIVQTVVEG